MFNKHFDYVCVFLSTGSGQRRPCGLHKIVCIIMHMNYAITLLWWFRSTLCALQRISTNSASPSWQACISGVQPFWAKRIVAGYSACKNLCIHLPPSSRQLLPQANAPPPSGDWLYLHLRKTDQIQCWSERPTWEQTSLPAVWEVYTSRCALFSQHTRLFRMLTSVSIGFEGSTSAATTSWRPLMLAKITAVNPF